MPKNGKPRQAARPRGRPVSHPLPDPIPDTAENIARTVLAGPPKKNWRYFRNRPSARRGSD